MEQADELNSIEDFISRVIKYDPRRDTTQIRGSIINNLSQLANGKWTWKFDKTPQSTGGEGQFRTAELIKRLWGYVEKLQRPTLVVKGDRSNVFSADTADKIHDIISGYKRAVVEKAGHLVM